MLALSTQIPTAVRGKIRALVKAHAAWAAFLAEKNILSAETRNVDLLEFALRHPTLSAEIEQILGIESYVGALHSIKPSEQPVIDSPQPVEPVQTVEGAYTIDGVLNGAEQFLSPYVKEMLIKELTPVIAAANKPAVEVERTIEVERIVEVTAGETPKRVAGPKARRERKTTFRALYPSKSKEGWNDAPITLWTGVPAPAQDPFYVVNRSSMAMFMTAIERGSNVWLAGPAGTGKSTLPEQAASMLGRPFVKIGMTRQTEIDSLIGGLSLVSGSTIWEDGALIKAMREPGTIILIDELTFAPAGVQAIIQLVADDHRSYQLPTGEVVKAADGVVFIVADNTNGSGDEGGLYAGTNISNAALITRFKRMIIIDYLSPQQEAEALANHTACPLPAARHLADFVAQARKLPAMAGVVISLRQMVGFTQCVQDGFTVQEAFVSAISCRMPSTERAAIEALIDLTWRGTYEALLRNTPVPVMPSNSPAAQAFGDENF